MDKVDEKILAILKKNARTRVSHIAREIHLSETSVIDHIKKMENSGVIKQYTTVIDYEKVGMIRWLGGGNHEINWVYQNGTYYVFDLTAYSCLGNYSD